MYSSAHRERNWEQNYLSCGENWTDNNFSPLYRKQNRIIYILQYIESGTENKTIYHMERAEPRTILVLCTESRTESYTYILQYIESGTKNKTIYHVERAEPRTILVLCTESRTESYVSFSTQRAELRTKLFSMWRGLNREQFYSSVQKAEPNHMYPSVHRERN